MMRLSFAEQQTTAGRAMATLSVFINGARLLSLEVNNRLGTLKSRGKRLEASQCIIARENARPVIASIIVVLLASSRR